MFVQTGAVTQLRAVVADDSLLIRAGVREILTAHGITVVGEASDGPTALDTVLKLEPDVAVLDIRMPPTNTDEGAVLAGTIRDQLPHVAVLLLSAHVDAVFATRLLGEQTQSVGYLLKDRVTDGVLLVDAVRRVAAGESVLDPTVVALLLGRRRDPDPLVHLSPREREVLGLMAEGRSNSGIADLLILSERTVETHVQQVFAKLGIAAERHDNRRVRAVLRCLGSS